MKQQKLQISKKSGALRLVDSDDEKEDISIESMDDLEKLNSQKNKLIYKSTNLITDSCTQISDISITSLEYATIQNDLSSFSAAQQDSEIVIKAKGDPVFQQRLSYLRDDHATVTEQEVHDLAEKIRAHLEEVQDHKSPKDLLKAISDLQYLRSTKHMVELNHRSNRPLGVPERAQQSLNMQSQKFQRRLMKVAQKHEILETKITEAQRLNKQEHLSVKQIKLRLGVSLHTLTKWKKREFNQASILKSEEKSRIRYKKITGRVKQVIHEFIDEAKEPIQVPAIQAYISSKVRVQCSSTMIRNYLKEVLDMRYRILAPITYNHNLPKNIFKRQTASSKFIKFFLERYDIINIDETVLRQTDNRVRGWVRIHQRNMVTNQQRLYQTNLICGVSSSGNCFFTLNRGKTNSLTFLLYLKKLIEHIEAKNPLWRQTTILMIDNAPYHRSKAVQKFLEDLQIPLMYLGPYQFKMAPVELFFSFIKQRDSNPQRIRLNTKQPGFLPNYIILQAIRRYLLEGIGIAHSKAKQDMVKKGL